ncbi:hypothetical protein BJF90_07375 [Pseudonocardia sp. CNS-004]|nr:hypothetical protein BJF90_07375 [Pseudonocardia sp. CNS-004]
MKSPVLIELVRQLGDSVYDLDGVDDVDLYEEIVFAVGHQHSTPDFHERAVPHLDGAEALVRERLGKGWFGDAPGPGTAGLVLGVGSGRRPRSA